MEYLEKYWPIIITIIAITFVVGQILLLSDIEQVNAQLTTTEQENQDQLLPAQTGSLVNACKAD